MVGVRIVLRVCYGDCRKYTGFPVLHESDDHQTVGGSGDLPGNGVTVEQQVQQLIDGGVHHGQDFAQLYSSMLILDSDSPFSWQ